MLGNWATICGKGDRSQIRASEVSCVRSIVLGDDNADGMLMISEIERSSIMTDVPRLMYFD